MGACLSSMGIVYNRDVLKRLGIAALLVAIPFAQAASESSSASTGRPRVVFRAGPGPGTVRIVPRPRTPLALVAVTSTWYVTPLVSPLIVQEVSVAGTGVQAAVTLPPLAAVQARAV